MTTEDTLKAWNDKQQAERSNRLGPSDAGKCRRSLAYRLHNVEPTEVVESKAALVGTLLHLAYAQVIDGTEEGREAEVEIEIAGLSRSGTADNVHWIDRVVTDLKTLDPSRFDAWKDHGVPEQVWEQIGLYALGLADKSGKDDWLMAVAALDRRSGRMMDFVQEWDRDWAEGIRDHLVWLEQSLLDNDPEAAPKDGKGRGSAPCSYCPWLTRCLGAADPEPVEAIELTEIEKIRAREAAAEYLDALAIKNAADARQKAARQTLAGISGDVGGFEIRWSGGRDKTEADVPAALELLEQLGAAIPEKSSTTAKRIVVHRM